MFGIEKVFGKKLSEQAEKKSVGGFDSPKKTETEILFFEQPLEVGQRWKTGDGNFDLVISDQRKGSGRYQIAFHDRKTGISEVQLKRSEDLKEMLSSDGYKLITKRSEGSESKLSFPSVVPVTSDQNSVISGTSETKETATPPLAAIVQETAAAGTDPQLPEPQPEQSERPEMPSLWDDYLSLDQEMRAIIDERVESIGTAIGEALEKNADVLGEKRDEFFESRDMLIGSINTVIDEDNALSETVEKTDQKITPPLLEAKQANHKKLLDLYEKLQSLKILADLEIAGAKDHPEANHTAPIVPEGEKSSLPEQVPPSGAGKVVHIDDYRKNFPSKPAAKPMDSPFGANAGTKKAETSQTESGEKALDAEEKIGQEQYDALTRFVESARQGFVTEMKDKKIPKRVWGKVWEAEALPYLRGRVEAFFREQTELRPDEYKTVCDSIIQVIAEKK